MPKIVPMMMFAFNAFIHCAEITENHCLQYTHLVKTMDAMYKLYHGDCLEIMPNLPEGIDAIITDLPYGRTGMKWDSVIPLEPMWKQVKRLLKTTGTFITTSSQPFTTFLIMSNLEWFKYEIIWRKSLVSGFSHAKNSPLKVHENIVVFSGGKICHQGKSEKRMTYNPQFSVGEPYKKYERANKIRWGTLSRLTRDYLKVNDGYRYPVSVLDCPNPNKNNVHPTQKPVALYEYLINTYTNPGETVLDICMGSGTTGVACANLNRNFIGIEQDLNYFNAAKERIEAAYKKSL